MTWPVTYPIGLRIVRNILGTFVNKKSGLWALIAHSPFSL